MKRITFKFPEREDDYRVHLPSHDLERTLCGLVFEGACMEINTQMQQFSVSRQKANCDQCRQVWLHCQNISKTDFTVSK